MNYSGKQVGQQDQQKTRLNGYGGDQADAIDQSEKQKRNDSIIDENFIGRFLNVRCSHTANIIDQFKDLFLIKKTEIK
jgi:hypothetical protein